MWLFLKIESTGVIETFKRSMLNLVHPIKLKKSMFESKSNHKDNKLIINPNNNKNSLINNNNKTNNNNNRINNNNNLISNKIDRGRRSINNKNLI